MKKMTILLSSIGENKKLALEMQRMASNMGFQVRTIDLVSLNLPLYSSLADEAGAPKEALTLCQQLIESDSLIVISPEYNGGVTPVLINTISWLSRSSENWRDAFNTKPTLIATHSGSGGAHVLMALRSQLSFMGANVIGREILTHYNKKLSLESLEACLLQLS